MAKPYGYSFSHVLSFVVVASGLLSATSAFGQRAMPLPPPPPIIWPDERIPDPARWTQEDVTPEQKYNTARKESLAAHQIAQTHCKTLPVSDHAICLAQARLEFEQEMTEIKAKFGISP